MHITGNMASFVPGTIRRCRTRIKVADGEIVHSKVMGTVRLESAYKGELVSTVLKNVRFLPGAAFNLVSVPRLDKDEGMTTAQGNGESIARDKKGKIALYGKLTQLYEVCLPNDFLK